MMHSYVIPFLREILDIDEHSAWNFVKLVDTLRRWKYVRLLDTL